MKTILKYLLFSLLLLFSALVIIGLFLPTAYSVSRELTINANVASVHPYVNDLARWESWSPWKDGDPSIVTTVGETSVGVGATSSWTGRDGQGSLEVTASSPETGVAYDLLFDQGAWRSSARIEYAEKTEDSTKLLWIMEGTVDAPVVGGYLALLMDRMVGPMFELGLKRLKTLVETNRDTTAMKSVPGQA